MKRVAILAAVVLIVAAAAFWAFDLPARFGWRHDDTGALTLYGNVDIRQVELGFRVAGRLQAVRAEEGDSIKAGTVLAELDPRPYQDSLDAATAQVGVQDANLQKLIAGPRPAEIAQARANVSEREADLTNAQRGFDRAQQLRPGGSISQAQLDEATATRNMASARLAASQQILSLLLEGSRAEDIAAGRAALASAKAAQASAQTQLTDTRLLAPADGIILSRVREPGAIVGPGDNVFVLSLTQPVWVRAYIAEPQLGRIHPGLAVTLQSDTPPQKTYHGHVGFISPVAEFTPKSVETAELRTDLVYRLRVIVDDADAALRQGMPVTVAIPLAATP